MPIQAPSDSGNAHLSIRDRFDGGMREVSLVSLLNVLLRRRALIIWSSLLCALAFTGYLLIAERTWTTSASFFPQGRKSSGNLSALAAQFGVPVGGGEVSESPSFYADLVKSRAILATVIDSGVTVPPGKHVDLAEWYKVKATTPALRRELAIQKLDGNVAVSTNAKTGVVTLKVTTNAPDLSASISARLLDLLNRFNLETRRSQATAERKFTQERLADVKKDLRNVEDALQNFLQVNKAFSAPQLQAQRDRIDRELRMQTELYTTLSKAYEQAKIDEVRDTPVITQVVRPEPAARPDPRGVVTRAIVSFVAGFLLGALIALMLDGFAPRDGTIDPEQDEFRRLSGATMRDIRRPWRLLRPFKA